MQKLEYAIPEFITVTSKRTPDPEFEQKKLLIHEFLNLINKDVKPPYKPITEMQLKCRMMDAGYRSAQSWYELLAEIKQAKSPGACWGSKTKRK